jgi:hypothetical protein
VRRRCPPRSATDKGGSRRRSGRRQRRSCRRGIPTLRAVPWRAIALTYRVATRTFPREPRIPFGSGEHRLPSRT